MIKPHCSNEPWHDKTNKVSVRPAPGTQQRLRSAWASAQSDQSSLCAQWVAKDPSFLHADSEDSDQTGRMPRLIWVFAGRTLVLLVLSCRGSNLNNMVLPELMCPIGADRFGLDRFVRKLRIVKVPVILLFLQRLMLLVSSYSETISPLLRCNPG